MRMTPRVTLILKRAYSPLVEKIAATWRREFRERFEDLFLTSLKIHNQLTDRINYFHSLMREDALQTFKNIKGPTRENLREILAVF